MKIRKKAIINKDECVACGTCLKVCPLGLIHIEAGLFAEINLEKCVGCGKCVKVCPASVIILEEIKYEEVKDNEKEEKNS